MEKKTNGLIIADCGPAESFDFLEALNANTKINWSIKNFICNGERNFFEEVKRYFTYVRAGFFASRKINKLDYIVCWQQLFGIFCAFFARLFRKKKKSKLIIMTFIYKGKKGIIGKLYKKVVSYALQSKYIDIITLSSQKEAKKYSELFNITIDKFKFLPWGQNKDSTITTNSKGNYLISIGRSNRDYNFLVESLTDYDYKTLIYSDEEKAVEHGNCKFTGVIKGANLALANSFCVIIPINDPSISAGQTLLINAMMYKKPIICTESSGLTDDYLINGFNGIIIKKDKNELIKAIESLKNEGYYNTIANNGYREWQEKYSIKAMGENMAKIVNLL